MPVEAPGELRIACKGARIGNFFEANLCACQCRIGAPEALGSAEIG